MDSKIVGCLNDDSVRRLLCAARLSSNDFEKMSVDTVDLVLAVLSHPMLQKYPLKTQYLAGFLKKIINHMGNSEIELCDQLYLKYVELIQKESEDEPFYKHYALGNGVRDELIESVITVQESTSIVSRGTTGLCTWQAGVALSCWCLKNKDRLRDKFVVELGCGTGMSGIAACVHCRPKQYWFTDCHSAVLNAVKRNIEINSTRHTFECEYSVVQLSWSDTVDDLETKFKDKKPDLILAADVVFDQSTFDPLCQLLKYFVANDTTEIILFCTLRNPETFDRFLETLEKFNMNFTQDILPDNYAVVLQQDCPIHVVNVKQKIKKHE